MRTKTHTAPRLLALLLAVALSTLMFVLQMPAVGAQCPKDTICILEPVPGSKLPGGNQIPADTPDVFELYLWGGNGALGLWHWALGTGIAIAVLNCTVAGYQIVLSNGDPGMIGNGKTRFMWATIGLMILFLAGTLLNFINPSGFVTTTPP